MDEFLDLGDLYVPELVLDPEDSEDEDLNILSSSDSTDGFTLVSAEDFVSPDISVLLPYLDSIDFTLSAILFTFLFVWFESKVKHIVTSFGR